MQQFYSGYQQPFGGMYQPPAPRYPQPMQQPYQTQESIIRVTGLDGARTYPVAPNGRVVLFDDARDVFYLKTADGGGYPTLTAYSFSPLREDAAPSPDYVTRDEFNKLKELIENAQQPVRKAKPDTAE